MKINKTTIFLNLKIKYRTKK